MAKTSLIGGGVIREITENPTSEFIQEAKENVVLKALSQEPPAYADKNDYTPEYAGPPKL